MKHSGMKERVLRRYTGNMNQIAGVRTAVLDDGKSRGVRVADVNNGSGLTYTVLLDKGLDIGPASYRGVPLAFLTPVGFAHPSLFDAQGLGWLRNWGGGLLTGCGMSNVGTPQKEDGYTVTGPLGAHGRLSNIPADTCSVSEAWVNGKYELAVSGVVRENCMFGENLELRRTLSTRMGENVITVRDTVTNAACRPAPLMLLYHINLGFPLLSEEAVLKAKPHKLTPRTPGAAIGLPIWNQCQPPTDGYAEQCFYHDLPVDKGGMARMSLENPALGLGVDVSYRKKELPFFTQWKMMGVGEYVMGLEPANCHPDGQAKERADGTLKTLKPGESVEFLVQIAIRDL